MQNKLFRRAIGFIVIANIIPLFCMAMALLEKAGGLKWYIIGWEVTGITALVGGVIAAIVLVLQWAFE